MYIDAISDEYTMPYEKIIIDLRGSDNEGASALREITTDQRIEVAAYLSTTLANTRGRLREIVRELKDTEGTPLIVRDGLFITVYKGKVKEVLKEVFARYKAEGKVKGRLIIGTTPIDQY